MDNKLTQDLVIPCYDADIAFNLRPASFMDLAQEIANVHAQILGFGYDDMQRTKTLWVLSRMHVKFEKYPLWRDKVTLKTWHKGPAGPFYLRDFQIVDSQDNVLVCATSSWLVIDASTRHISRNTKIMDEKTACMENAIERACDKVQMPRGVEPVKVAGHKVVYSDLDMNGHTNNAKYIVWALDAMDCDFVLAHPVKEFRIVFNNETRLGDEVELYRADVAADTSDISEAELGKTYIEGKVEGKQAFCVELVW